MWLLPCIFVFFDYAAMIQYPCDIILHLKQEKSIRGFINNITISVVIHSPIPPPEAIYFT